MNDTGTYICEQFHGSQNVPIPFELNVIDPNEEYHWKLSMNLPPFIYMESRFIIDVSSKVLMKNWRRIKLDIVYLPKTYERPLFFKRKIKSYFKIKILFLFLFKNTNFITITVITMAYLI